MAFCDSRQFSAVQLWTFKGLDAARKLYESGFTLIREWQGSSGKVMTEQQLPVRKHRLRVLRLSRWGHGDYVSWLSRRAISSCHCACSDGFDVWLAGHVVSQPLLGQSAAPAAPPHHRQPRRVYSAKRADCPGRAPRPADGHRPPRLCHSVSPALSISQKRLQLSLISWRS